MESGKRVQGPTPAGGVATISYFSNKAGALPTDEGATDVEIHEIGADGVVIARTYAKLGK